MNELAQIYEREPKLFNDAQTRDNIMFFVFPEQFLVELFCALREEGGRSALFYPLTLTSTPQFPLSGMANTSFHSDLYYFFLSFNKKRSYEIARQ